MKLITYQPDTVSKVADIMIMLEDYDYEAIKAEEPKIKVFDYIGLLTTPTEERSYDDLRKIAMEIRALAMKRNIPIITAVQEPEDENNKTTDSGVMRLLVPRRVQGSRSYFEGFTPSNSGSDS